MAPVTLVTPPVFSGVRFTRSFVLYVCFVDRCLSFCAFSFGHCVVCSSSIYGLWFPLWYLQTLLTNQVIRHACGSGFQAPYVLVCLCSIARGECSCSIRRELYRWCNGQRVRLEWYIDCGFEPRSGPTKDYTINVCCLSAKHAALRRKSKDWVSRNNENVSKWNDMSTCGLLFKWASTIQSN